MSMPPNMMPQAAIMDELFQETLDLVNACSRKYGEFDGNQKYRVELIQHALKRADETVTGHFLAIAGHPRRADFITEEEVAHGELIPSHIGPVDSIRVGSSVGSAEAAAPWPAAEIEIIRRNVSGGLSLKVVGPKYAIEGNRLYIVSADIADIGFVGVANFKAMTMGFMSPPEFSNAVIAWALRYIFGKSATDTEARGQINFGAIADTVMKYVEGNQMVPPMAQEAING